MMNRERVFDFCKTMCNRYDSGDIFNDEELEFMALNSIEEREGTEHRWTRDVESIFKCGERYFIIRWERGLTEYQYNQFYEQPVEATIKEYEKVVRIREWIPIVKETKRD